LILESCGVILPLILEPQKPREDLAYLVWTQIFIRRKEMAIFKCNKCGNTIDVVSPPEKCPACKQSCEFVDVSCYIPECGGPDSGNINPQVFQESYKSDKK
jgi:hypothetical protein